MRVRPEAGSVLALVPAGFLVLIVLSALAVDSAVAYLGQRQLHDALAAAANDSVTAGIDNMSFYRSGVVTLDPVAVADTVCADLTAQQDSGLHSVSVRLSLSGDSVRLSAHASVDAVFGRALPGFGRRSVSAVASASAAEGPGPLPVVAFPAPVRLRCG